MKKTLKIIYKILTLSFISVGSSAYADLVKSAAYQLPDMDYDMFFKLDHYTQEEIQSLILSLDLARSGEEKQKILGKIKAYGEVFHVSSIGPCQGCKGR